MHLCQQHIDEEADPHRPARARTQAAVRAKQPQAAPRCATCRGFLPDPRLMLCESCAREGGLCQLCSASTRTPEEIALLETQEGFEKVLDLATLLMKTYGIGAMRELIASNREAIGTEMADRVLAFDAQRPLDTMSYLDKRIDRPIWTKVLGANVFRLRRCADCAPPPRSPRRLVAATQCLHLTPGLSAVWCPLCASDRNVCESCGATTE
jgi:hypothetical protein